MKKILSLALIIIFCGAQLCFAEVNDDEDIDQYFVDEPTVEQPQLDENQVKNKDSNVNDAVNIEAAQPSTENPEQNVSLQSDSDIELNGYLQYNQQGEEDVEDSSIHLDPVENRSVNFSKPKKLNSNDLFADFKKPSFSPIQDQENLEAAASKFSSQEYQINPVSTSYSKKIGRFSFGTMYDSYIDSAQVNYSTGLFSKYETKHFAVSTAFSKSTNSNYDTYNEKIYLIPEWKITKRLSLLDVMQTDVEQINKKNELVLRYTPHFKNHSDDVQFEVGAGQSYYDDNYVKSSVRFSTKFKL